tara:strand:- start:1463 stop:1900 length:438 start_codon:yes stop_codon:yes gene_type:complete
MTRKKYPYVSGNLFYLNKRSNGRKITPSLIKKYPAAFKDKKYANIRKKYLSNKSEIKNKTKKKVKKTIKKSKKLNQKGGAPEPASADGDIGTFVNDIVGLIYYTGESIVNGVELVWDVVNLPSDLGTAWESSVGSNDPPLAQSLI